MNSGKHWEELFDMLRDRDWAAARDCIDQIISSEPRNPNHHLKKGDICLKTGDKAGALEAYLKAARYLEKGGFLKKALAIHKMVLRADSVNEEAIRSVNRLLTEIGSAPPACLKSAGSSATGGASPVESGGQESEAGMGTAGSLEVEHGAAQYPEGTGSPEPRLEEWEAADGSPWFLSYFPAARREEIMTRAELKSYTDGQPVVQEGDTGDSIYVLSKGFASVIGHFFGKVIHLETLSAGDMFGEVAFLTGRTRTAHVVAKGDLEVYEIGRLLLEELIEEEPEILSRINEIYIKRVRETVRKVKSENEKSRQLPPS